MTATLLLLVLAVLCLLLLGGFALTSLREGEKRAAAISSIAALIGAAVLAGCAFLPAPLPGLGLVVVAVGGLFAMGTFLLPGKPPERLRDEPNRRVDERDIMFARARLEPGTPRYAQYYTLRPENEAKDARFRERPGLFSAKALYADPLLFSAPQASFTLTEALHSVVEKEAAPERVRLPGNPERTSFIKALARYFGALEVGVTELRPYHVYSHIGRGSGVYGAPLEVEHRYAIAFTVEMDFEMLGCAPAAPAAMESAHQYVEAGRTAIQLAEAIRQMGYPARAHMDGDYRVICPLVARDAGLGEIGRMGLLMTPRLGPRVRLAVVTTDLELISDAATPDDSVIDFCEQCGKCALNCPAKAIPTGGRVEIDGALRWQIDSDACYRYWCTVGTDCGRCMAVCPYSHPDSFYHNLVRWGNARAALFRRLALRLDDLCYGQKPPSRQPPDWINRGAVQKEGRSGPQPP
jgi:reductive dehalogenase